MIVIIGYKIDITDDLYHAIGMNGRPATQPEQALTLLKQHGLVRLGEFTKHGITAATIQRLEQKGQVTRLARGLYQLPGAELNVHHTLVEAAKLVPKGVICLTSALVYHELTDTISSRVWMAIGPEIRRPRVSDPPLQLVRFGPKVLKLGVRRIRSRVYRFASTPQPKRSSTCSVIDTPLGRATAKAPV